MLQIENDLLAVRLHEWPAVDQYTYKATGTKLGGSGPKGRLAVNGEEVGWDEWDIASSPSADRTSVSYSLTLKRTGLRLAMDYRLEENALKLTVEAVDDPGERLVRLDWSGQPLLSCAEAGFSFERTEIRQKSWKLIPGGGRGLYDRMRAGDKIGDAIPDAVDVPTMHACIFDGRLCCFVQTNYPVVPLLSRLLPHERLPGRAGGFAIGPNTYQYRVRNQTMPPLELKAVFLEDINGDGIADECDYQLWMNRKLPDADPMYTNGIWYKVFNAEKERGVLTTFKETLEIIRMICHVTDGMPQIAYLTGWQYDGHDTGFPSMNRINPQLAENPERASEELEELVRVARERYNCVVSYHINLDDAYVDAPDWNPALLSRDPDGSARVWLDTAKQRAYHLCHTKDVESGDVFRRIDDFLRTVPVSRTVQVDAFRNTNASWETDGYIGPLEELVCGMKPILAYFRERGIDVSTEGQNGMPVEDGGLFGAYWHYSPSLHYHGKIVGGGSVDMNAVAWGKGASFDSDVLYRGAPTRLLGEQFHANDFLSGWERIVDIIFLGSLLYRFYLAREMVEWREDEEKVYIRYADGVTVNIRKKEQQLTVRWDRLVIADNDDRFIPLEDRIYLYSRHGSDRSWPLPPDWLETGIAAVRLEADGGRPPAAFELTDGEIRLRLDPRTPVMLTRQRNA